MGVVNNGCGQLHVRELQGKQNKVTLFGERASSDTDNLSKSWRRLLWIL